MKKIVCAALALTMALCLFTGCGGNSNLFAEMTGNATPTPTAAGSLTEGFRQNNNESPSGDASLIGGNQKSRTPEEVIVAYVESINNNDIDAVLECIIPDAHSSALESFEAMQEEGIRLSEGVWGSDSRMEIYVDNTEIDGNEAAVTCTLVAENGDWESGILMLEKIDGRWYVNGDGDMLDSGNLYDGNSDQGYSYADGTTEGASSPAEAVEVLIYAISYNDHEAFLSVLPPELHSSVQEKLDMINEEGMTLSESMYDEETMLSVEISDVELDGDEAVVICTLTDGVDYEEGKIDCIRIDGGWYINFDF